MGRFVVFEGLDGAGKSTQIQRLDERLRQAGVSVDLVREPGGTQAGEAIRTVMFGPDAVPLEPKTWAFLMNSARSQLIEERVRPALESGKTVLADRYWYSTLAYQGGGEELDDSFIRQVSVLATGGLEPDLVVYLDLPADEVVTRKQVTTQNVLDRRPLEFHRRVAAAYDRMVAADPERWACFDATRPVDVLGDDIFNTVSERLQIPSSVSAA